ncbi:hypothetical protein HJG60_007830 [Phyllostomus discolor]|uniref:Uncharacterized protein n=1 Tax=Phyllostomus discolor TaxID=89673 RepID=A0A834BD44_9CHIR|nr:hypothetical protein HJG60_007830 [Phyllostomus discolor]
MLLLEVRPSFCLFCVSKKRKGQNLGLGTSEEPQQGGGGHGATCWPWWHTPGHIHSPGLRGSHLADHQNHLQGLYQLHPRPRLPQRRLQVATAQRAHVAGHAPPSTARPPCGAASPKGERLFFT